MQKEIWKDIPDYENYQASNLGRIKTKARLSTCKTCEPRIIKEKIRLGSLDSNGYRLTTITKNGLTKYFRVHQLVAMAFLKHRPKDTKMVIDHIDGDKGNNKLSNIRVVSQRKNCHNQHNRRKTSKYTGVSFYDNAYHVRIWNNKLGKNEYLGRFKNEKKASEAYQNRLKSLINEEM